MYSLNSSLSWQKNGLTKVQLLSSWKNNVTFKLQLFLFPSPLRHQTLFYQKHFNRLFKFFIRMPKDNFYQVLPKDQLFHSYKPVLPLLKPKIYLSPPPPKHRYTQNICMDSSNSSLSWKISFL